MSKSNKNKKGQNPMAKLAQQHLKLVAEENARIKALQDEEERKIREEEEKEKARLKAIEEEAYRKRKAKQDKKQAQKDAGTYKTKSEKEKDKKLRLRLEELKKNVVLNDNGRMTVNSNNSLNKSILNEEIIDYGYRSPIMCIMGHVDTGKTTLLDNIRNTHVQDGEAGGITQQIGASFIPPETLINRSGISKIPGLLMIDTPGHEAFANLRHRGSSLCDIAIVVIDITGGLEQQTIQSINILVKSNIKFIFALNKIDRMYGWSSVKNRDIRSSLNENLISNEEFKNRLKNITTQIMKVGLNAELFWENYSPQDTISICPFSAKTGEGISDLLKLVTSICQNEMSEQITFKEDLKCIVIEKTINETLGSSIDVILINGTLKRGDNISIQTNDGIINTTIKNLLTPPPNRESRVKTDYLHFESVKGSMGVKIVANNIDKAIVGTQINFTTDNNIELELPEMSSIKLQDESIKLQNESIKLQDEGITIYASTQGALEALVHYLQKECTPAVPISNVLIGNVTKKHIVKLSISKSTKKEYSTILAFNVLIDDDAQELANKNGIKIFSAEIIYHLFDFYKKYRDEMIEERKSLYRPQVVFPCILKILEKHVYNKKNPLIFGVSILEGNLHIGTPIITSDTKTYIGRVIGIQLNSNEVTIGKKGAEVCIKVENDQNSNIMYGRQFDHKNPICSAITRASIDIIKNHFRDEATIEDAKLLSKLKTLLSID